MGFFDDSIIGFDFNMDGKTDMLDDVLFMQMMDEAEKEEEEEEDEDRDDLCDDRDDLDDDYDEFDSDFDF